MIKFGKCDTSKIDDLEKRISLLESMVSKLDEDFLLTSETHPSSYLGWNNRPKIRLADAFKLICHHLDIVLYREPLKSSYDKILTKKEYQEVCKKI